MHRATHALLARRFDFEAWKGAPRGASRLAIDGLFDVDTRLGRWTARRAVPATFPGARVAQRSMWQQVSSPEAIMRLDLFEAASPAAAREIVLELLGEFESAQIQRIASPPAGDLAFGGPGDTALLFTRANVAALVRNAGRDVVKVSPFARLVDGRLSGPQSK